MGYKYNKIIIIFILSIILYLIIYDYKLNYETFHKRGHYGLMTNPIIKYINNINIINKKNKNILLSEYKKRCSLCKNSCKNIYTGFFKENISKEKYSSKEKNDCIYKCNNTRFCKEIIPIDPSTVFSNIL